MIEKYVWSDIKKQVREWAKACIRCQKCKVSRHTKSKLGDFEQPDERFSVVHIDLIGKLPPSEGMQYCLTCIDRFSCWMEAIPIPEITAEIVGRAFYEKWICRFGVPAKIVTDQGRQFEAELFRSIAAICGAKVAHTTSYHPQCNGKVERLHRTLKGAIKAHNNIRWTESLPTVLLGLRAAIRPDISYTIAQMVYDRLKPAYLLAVDNQNEQTSVGQKNEISNWKELSPMPDEQSTTSCGRKIKKPPDGRGYELVSSVRALVPQKFSVEEELMHVKHVDVKSPHVGVMWKFGRGVISSAFSLGGSFESFDYKKWSMGENSLGTRSKKRGEALASSVLPV
ncbi:hypothetical protein TNCV_158031 [Trichonephila clavipes]|nr:hypothetical protein TNCV_158031 [Trichonephila clavipes]